MANERSSYPRYPVNSPAQVRLDDAPDAGFATTINNLSRTSMEIVCEAELVTALLRQQTLPYTCQVNFMLPWHTHKFSITAHVVTQRRVSRKQYVLVLLLKHADQALENLLGDLLARKQPIGLD